MFVATEPGPPYPVTKPHSEWTSIQRVAFRFAFVYLGLYAFPFPLSDIPATESIAEWYENQWNVVTRWLGPRLFGLDVLPLRYGSGDAAHHYTLLFCKGVLALVATAVWTTRDRGRGTYVRLHEMLRVYLRYTLGVTMIAYAAVKIVPTQFPDIGFVTLQEPVGNASPMGLLWRFMGYGETYNLFTGLGELVAGTLLFFRRTSTAGALMTVVVLANVVVMNFTYDVPVKIHSTHLLIIAVFLILPDAKRLLDVLVLHRPTQPREQEDLFGSGRVRAVARAMGALIVLWPTWAFFSGAYRHYNFRSQLPALYGIYEVEQHIRNADTIPPLLTDPTRWRRLIVDNYANAPMTIQTMTSPLQGSDALRYRFAADTTAQTFRLTPFDDSTNARTFTYEQNGNRLFATGIWEGDTLHLVLRRFDEDSFLLRHRGFRWIQEFPFSR